VRRLASLRNVHANSGQKGDGVIAGIEKKAFRGIFFDVGMRLHIALVTIRISDEQDDIRDIRRFGQRVLLERISLDRESQLKYTRL